jgi:hypothetical protein
LESRGVGEQGSWSAGELQAEWRWMQGERSNIQRDAVTS